MTMMGSSVSKIVESKDKNFPTGSRIIAYTGMLSTHYPNTSYSQWKSIPMTVFYEEFLIL